MRGPADATCDRVLLWAFWLAAGCLTGLFAWRGHWARGPVVAMMDRKPLQKADPPIPESREPKSIRFTPSEWDAIADAARARLLEPAVFVRALTMYALSIVQAPALTEASLGMPRQMLAGAARTRRF